MAGSGLEDCASPVFADDVMKFAFGSDAAPFAWEKDGQAYGILIDMSSTLTVTSEHERPQLQQCD